MSEQNATENSQQTTLPAIAPWWHTVLLIVPLLAFSLLGSLKPAHHALSQHHIPQYLATLAWEWILAALVALGHPHAQDSAAPASRRAPTHVARMERRSRHRRRFLDRVHDYSRGLGAVLRLAHLSTPQKALAQLAPQNALELLLWVILSISAGICEELTFRGYLLQQFSRASGKIWIGVLASSLLFGIAHGYEGVSGMIAITLYGALFCILAIKRGSLRPGMMAHAWQDIFSGIALMVLKHAHVF